MTDLDAARARHELAPEDPQDPHCFECGQDWPCDFALAIAALDDCRAGAVAAVDGYNEACLFVEAERDAARALADEWRMTATLLADANAVVQDTLYVLAPNSIEGMNARQVLRHAQGVYDAALAKWEASRGD